TDGLTQTGAPRRRFSLSIGRGSGLAGCARVEDRDRAPVLRPAGNIVADGDGAFLAVGNRAHARGRDSLGGQIIAHGLSAAGAERDVVFARAAFVRVSFDREGVAIVELQPP